ncbi:MAG: hypothetical protein IKA74_04730 [Clostridia bacterium]|nr:hypothetical protein [Clostridia bacterium]
MEIKITEINRVFSESGAVLLAASLDSLAFEGGKGSGRAEKYYREINDRYLDSLEKAVFPRLQGAYISSPDPKVRFKYKRIDFSHRITVQNKTAKYISVTRTVTMKKRGREIAYRLSGDVISQKSGRLLPVNLFISRIRLFRLGRRLKKTLGERVKLSSFYINSEVQIVLIYSSEKNVYECRVCGEVLTKRRKQ